MKKTKEELDKQQEFYRNPDKYLSIDEMGDQALGWFCGRYVAMRMLKLMPTFHQAYQVLTERGNYSRNNAFGEMHSDRYLWILKHETIKVLVEQRQSSKYIYICDESKKYGNEFHIRELHDNYSGRSKKGITEAKFKKQGFVPYCPKDYKEERFSAFTYGDARDAGFILSIRYSKYDSDYSADSLLRESDFISNKVFGVLQGVEYWQHFLDNPEELY